MIRQTGATLWPGRITVTDAEEINEQVPAAGLDVQLAAELIERAKAQGVSLVGPDGLLAGITKTGRWRPVRSLPGLEPSRPANKAW